MLLPSFPASPSLPRGFMLADSTAIAIAWAGLPAPSSFQSQMMLLGGMVLLGWVLMRRNLRARRRGRREAAEWQQQEQQAAGRRAAASVPLGDAPVEVLRWQAAMFDLQRELKAELETKISVVQAMIQLADQRIATLERLDRSTAEHPATDDANGSSHA